MRVAEHVRSTHRQDGGIVLDILQGKMFRLNFVGSKILELLRQGRTESEIAQELVVEFGIDRTAAEADVREFVATLKKNLLICAGRPDSI